MYDNFLLIELKYPGHQLNKEVFPKFVILEHQSTESTTVVAAGSYFGTLITCHCAN